MLTSVDDAETFVLQLEKEMEARKQTMKWEKEFEEHQADGEVCLECRKCISRTETHEHMVYDLQNVLRATKRKENGFLKMIKDHKRDLANIENSLAELQKEKELVEKKLKMCNTGIFALSEIDKKVTGDAKSMLAGMETFKKHFGDVEMALPMNFNFTELFAMACEMGDSGTIRKLLKLLDNFPVSGKVFSVTNKPNNMFFTAAKSQLERRILCEKYLLNKTDKQAEESYCECLSVHLHRQLI